MLPRGGIRIAKTVSSTFLSSSTPSSALKSAPLCGSCLYRELSTGVDSPSHANQQCNPPKDIKNTFNSAKSTATDAFGKPIPSPRPKRNLNNFARSSRWFFRASTTQSPTFSSANKGFNCIFDDCNLNFGRSASARFFHSTCALLSSRRSQSWRCSDLNLRLSIIAPNRAAKRDPYEILGVGKSASASEIKKAYYQVRFEERSRTMKPGLLTLFCPIFSAFSSLKNTTQIQIKRRALTTSLWRFRRLTRCVSRGGEDQFRFFAD